MKNKNNLLVVFVLIIASCSDVNKSKNFEVSLHDKPLLEVPVQPRPLPNPDKNAYFCEPELMAATVLVKTSIF